ncbi:hypothetical protein [Diplocloster modestus]|uniref:HK97 gp10 family phage protein n=1 Tax=Diplocloster modestus TaxID=2850322 RepID=A0ABS6KCM3_9FIRM|nr:hypothetical protein [Diplocloster modestus]MBU9728271.1 hypothetical protein [Diplocloster modestus]
MSSNSVKPDDLAKAIAEGLGEWCEEVATSVFEAVDMAADRCNEEIKTHLSTGYGVRTGKYIKAFRIETTEQTKFNKKKTWYVASQEYRKTHLLENGHALRQGGRSPQIKHIEFGEQIAQETMVELCEKAVSAE